MQVNPSRVLKSLYRDLGFHQLQVPELGSRVGDILEEYIDDLDGFRREGSILCQEIRANDTYRAMSPSDARRVFQFFGVFDKTPGNLKRDEVLHRLITKQPKIGNVLLDEPDIRRLRRIIRAWIGDTPWGDAEKLPKHGPGATAEKAIWDDKWHALRSRPASLEKLYSVIDPMGRLPLKSVDDHPARVIVVEKNWKGGRVIAAEQTSRQFVQQALGRVMIDRLKRKASIDITDAARHILFLKDRLSDAVTIDLSDASDFLSVKLVAALFPREWCRALFASRSPKLAVQGSVIKTKTFASMGNGFCFSVLTVVCGALCAHASGRWRSYKDWSVYGDDIIIISRHYDKVRQLIMRAGLVINDDKTFTPDCPFAETCGVDYWRLTRTNVRPKYFRAHLKLTDNHDLVKLAEFQRYAVAAGWTQTSAYLGSLLGRDYPLQCNEVIDLPGWVWHPNAPGRATHPHLRMNKRYQRLEGRAFVGSDPRRTAALAEGESWAKATFGGDVQCETLSRSRKLKLKWLPVP